MVNAHEVPANILIDKITADLKKTSQLTPPVWISYVKSSPNRHRLPDNDDWWYTRCASILRKIYFNGPIGLSKLEFEYGGNVKKGYKPKKHVNSGGSIIRNALQQLESIGLISKTESNGRIITSKCSSIIDKASTEILKQLINQIPDMKRYMSDKNE